MKVLCKVLSAALAFCLFCVGLVGCTPASTANAEELSYISMRINPEIELVVDKEGEVVAANAINEDGETVLCQLDLVGMTAEEAAEAFTAMATELGFIDVDAEEATVYILAEGKNEEFIEELEEKLTERIHKFFDKKGIFGKVSPEDLEKYEALATEWNVSLQEARVISRILELYPEMTVEEILELDFKERMGLIKEDCKKHGLPAHLRGEYKQAVEALKEEYAELFELRKALKELGHKLRDRELTEEERVALQEEFEAKKAEYDALAAEFEAALAQLKAEMQEEIEEIKQEIENHANDRREEFEDKLREHEKNFWEKKEEIEREIQEWREQHHHR